ncbi:unnamed protein product [Kluyveromyces dobzhanskii CBS 2104]|uniref:WGS project CCBQ000000000 data, contig 00015 n=1 Tax=Kluyveromyces dobzhanskii CBS 2104 TaxID=1427455 RepID=A0A0A8LBN0_9SACH|nr:unnamed protein product [Kluyveromyces dobzhanskii CBS 2104]
MRMLRSKNVNGVSGASGIRTRGAMQTITPEEPGKQESGLESVVSRSDSRSRSRSQSVAMLSDELQVEYDVLQETQHSLKSTRLLELDIANAVSELERIEPRTESTTKIIALLNRSLSAVSHWSLQAQLSHWENRKEKDERFAVEKNLVKREAEYFKNKLLESEKLQMQTRAQAQAQAQAQVQVQGVCSSPPTGAGVSSATNVLLSPKRVTKQRKITSPRRNNNIFHTHPPTPTLKLVENTKPHPRLKRNLNDQTNQDLIRVFHLEKER